jgi:hypothetical protein
VDQFSQSQTWLSCLETNLSFKFGYGEAEYGDWQIGRSVNGSIGRWQRGSE